MHAQPITSDDLPLLNAWARDWKMAPFPPGWLPPTGFWVKNLCAAFLYKTEAEVAFIECFISNPNASKQERREAIKLVAEACEKAAVEAGYRYLQGQTAHRSIREVGIELGYREAGDVQVMVKVISEGT